MLPSQSSSLIKTQASPFVCRLIVMNANLAVLPSGGRGRPGGPVPSVSAVCFLALCVVDASGLTCAALLSPSVPLCLSHGAAEEAEATIQGERGRQEAKAAQSPERSKQPVSAAAPRVECLPSAPLPLFSACAKQSKPSSLSCQHKMGRRDRSLSPPPLFLF